MKTANHSANLRHQARVVAIASGKGGVGKSNVALNLSIALARIGKRVILWDLDLGLANVDVLLNLDIQADLSHVLSGEKRIEDIIIDTPAHIQVIPGASGDERLANLNEKELQFLLKALNSLSEQTDYIILDTGAGVSDDTISFITSADEAIVVTTPEPTAMVDAYATIKLTHSISPETHIHLLVNMARNPHEAQQTIERMKTIAEHFISSHLEDDGFLLYDPAVGDAVRHRKPFIISAPDSQPARSLKKTAYALLNSHIHDREQASEPQGFIQKLLTRLALS